MNIKFYHYPKCRKSRAALALIQDLGLKVEVINFMDEGLDEETLSHLFELLGESPSEMVRTQEDYYKDHIKGRLLSEKEWYKLFIEYPKLLRRPIVIKGNKAIVADPAELIKQIL